MDLLTKSRNETRKCLHEILMSVLCWLQGIHKIEIPLYNELYNTPINTSAYFLVVLVSVRIC